MTNALAALWMYVVLTSVLLVSAGIVWIAQKVSFAKCQNWREESNARPRR